MTEQPKKRWQFSLGRALGAMTLICVELAVARALANEANGAISGVVVLMGFGSAVGIIVGGIKGAVWGAIAGIVVFVLFFYLVVAPTLFLQGFY